MCYKSSGYTTWCFWNHPRPMVRKILAVSRGFLWDQNETSGQRIPFIVWEWLSWPKIKGGLSLKDFRVTQMLYYLKTNEASSDWQNWWELWHLSRNCWDYSTPLLCLLTCLTLLVIQLFVIYQVLWSIWHARNGQSFDLSKRWTFTKQLVMSENQIMYLVWELLYMLPGTQHTWLLRATVISAAEQFTLLGLVYSRQ